MNRPYAVLLPLLVAAAAAGGCSRNIVRPSERMPLVEIEVNDSATPADDYCSTTPVPCRARITNPTEWDHPTFAADIAVRLRGLNTAGGGQIRFSPTAAAAGTSTLDLSLPASGAWAVFHVRALAGSMSAADKDVSIEMSENRPGLDNVVLARKALMATASPPAPPATLVEIQLTNSSITIDDYVTWSPTYARARISNPASVSGDLAVTVQNMAGSGDRLRFAAAGSLTPHTNTASAATLALMLPADGAWAEFFVAGKFGAPSSRDKDAVLEIRNGDTLLAREALMVRIRKNANALSTEERNRFLDALGKHNLTYGLYETGQTVHNLAYYEAHETPAFYPWHRVFILRLERELQGIDPSVALPYWRFDQPAPNLFHQDFLGANPAAADPPYAVFAPANPLNTWTISGLSGVRRRPTFAASGTPPGIVNQANTLALGTTYVGLRASSEGNPHGRAHTQGGGTAGWLYDPAISVRDPIFFLLHCNVDRLWGLWQWTNNRWDPLSLQAYAPQGAFPSPPSGSVHVGAYAEDEMWPWNGATGSGGTGIADRPSTAPGGTFPLVQGTLLAPPPKPKVKDVNDYRSSRLFTTVNPGLGFAYDDVQY